MTSRNMKPGKSTFEPPEYEEKMSNLFFIGLNPRWQMYRFLPSGLNMMFSAMAAWRDGDWLRPIKKFPKKAGLKILDCGGFLAMQKYGKFPFSVVNYANFVIVMRPNLYAAMDYMCEPEARREFGLSTNRERIQATIQNCLELMEWESHLPGQILPVIQGYLLEEYEYCLALHREAGTIREYMAVGSMCRRLSSPELNRLIPGIYSAARRAGCERLHFFGLKLSPDLEPLKEYIWSRDSAVALDAYNPELRAQRNGRRWPKGQAEKKKVFIDFLGRLDSLSLQYLATKTQGDKR